MTNNNYASPFLRILAYLTDLLITIAIFLALVRWMIFKPAESLNIGVILDGGLFILIFSIYYSLFINLFTAFLTHKFGGTIGKLMWGLGVVNESGKLLSFRQSLFRTYIGRPVAMVFFGMGYIWIFIDQKRRGWHDLVSGSVVVSRSPYGSVFGALFLIMLFGINLFLVRSLAERYFQNRLLFADLKEEIAEIFKLSKPGEQDVFPENPPVIREDMPISAGPTKIPTGYIIFKRDTYPFLFIYPYDYFLSNKSPKDLSFIEINLLSNIDPVDAPIKERKVTVRISNRIYSGGFPDFTDIIFEEYCPGISKKCILTDSGFDGKYGFEVTDKYNKRLETFIDDPGSDNIYQISLTVEDENNGIREEEREIYQKIVDSFQLTEIPTVLNN